VRGSFVQRRAPALKLSRRTIILGIIAAAVVTAAVVATLVNGTSDGVSKQRKAVTAYIQTVNLIESQMGIQLVRARTAYVDLGGNSARRKRAPAELATAETTLTRLERRLVAAPAPTEAKKLRALLVKLVAQQSALTREVHQLAVFSPQFAVYVRRLRAISSRFDRAMNAISKPTQKPVHGTKAQVLAAEQHFRVQENAAATAQASAIDAYVGGIAGLLKGLDTIAPPRVVAPSFAAELRSLHDVTVTGARLSSALRSVTRAHLAERIRAFTLAGREAASVAAQRAQIAAIRAYNRRSRAVGTTQAAVQAELRRLGRDLP
jgi:hypothetical protein